MRQFNDTLATSVPHSHRIVTLALTWNVFSIYRNMHTTIFFLVSFAFCHIFLWDFESSLLRFLSSRCIWKEKFNAIHFISILFFKKISLVFFFCALAMISTVWFCPHRFVWIAMLSGYILGFANDSENSHAEYNAFWHVLRIIGFCLSFGNSCANPIALYFVSAAFRKHFNR